MTDHERDRLRKVEAQAKASLSDRMDELAALQARLSDARAARDKWIRLFSRLESAVIHHRNAKQDLFVDEVDEALYSAWDKIIRESLDRP
jgi:hypothetical protein